MLFRSNRVGVDLNTASAPLLEHISGISKTIAKNIVEYREKNGRFLNRRQLLKVPKLGPKAFEQCAGFMRITDGDNPLDATSVHPESYEATLKLLDKIGLTMEDVKAVQAKATGEKKEPKKKTNVKKKNTTMGKALAEAMFLEEMREEDRKSGGRLEGNIKNKEKLAKELGIGEITLTDILKELEKPARDPRDDMPKPILRSDVLEMKDLVPGMILKGTIRNIIDFGAFVDIGVHQDGLVHISEMTDRFIKHPLEVVKIGDIVDVEVLGVDIGKKRISLTMKVKK